MENYNNMMGNDYNAMVYGSNMDQQHPMSSIPREMQISQTPIHQLPVQQPDIINLSYHQREIQMPHPNLPQQMGLFPTVPSNLPPIQIHNHIMHQQQPVNINTSEQQIPQNVNIQYSIDNVNVNVNLDVQNNNEHYDETVAKDPTNNDDNGVDASNSQISTPLKSEDVNSTQNDKQDQLPDINQEEVSKKKEPEVDPNQCRVCKNSEQLIDIFAIEEDMRICDIIMKICSNVRIHERDYLPHMICLGCLGRLRTAYQFVKEVQATDKELRSKLKRSKSKVRKPSDGFVLIDCNEFSESDDDDLQNDDEEFKVSDVEEDESEDTESGETDDSRKVKPPKKRGPRKSKSRKMKQELVSTAKRLKRDIVFIEAADSSEEKKKKEKCKECNKVFSNKNSLRLHRKNAHFRSGEDAAFKCHICGRGFKYSINLSSHMQIHKESYSCDECGRVFATKSDVKKHALNQHKCSLSYECNKCRRLYCSVKRYQKHRESCSDYGSASNKKKQHSKMKEDFSFTGRDLFKTVAPVTTTYWSDSFSD
ncbi:CLUMA_CG013466, isoform A [Clunio marinus]|uniref:CLUMA_CG013466, isoform A n=1 Tax=Clunio marinus TaxID=568069 RepID=A0A1J1IJ14_9DIPT|nr:CLUMA_CG013466, isoform A [Clunio marinus]